jgi:hypothetical protein
VEASLALVYYSDMNAFLWSYYSWKSSVINHLVWFLVLLNLKEWDGKLYRIGHAWKKPAQGSSVRPPSPQSPS